MKNLTIILACFLLLACTRPESGLQDLQEPPEILLPADNYSSTEDYEPVYATETFDITEVPVFPLDDNNLTSMNISINGIAFGNTTQQVMKAFGPPDEVLERLEYGIAILRYEHENKSKIVFNLQDNHVDRITIYLPFNDELQKPNKIDFHKRNITEWYGKPSSVKTYIPFSIFNYDELGIGLMHRRMTARGMTFYVPNNGENETETYDTETD